MTTLFNRIHIDSSIIKDCCFSIDDNALKGNHEVVIANIDKIIRVATSLREWLKTQEIIRKS